jgi:TorA maturation chaperone TorD
VERGTGLPDQSRAALESFLGGLLLYELEASSIARIRDSQAAEVLDRLHPGCARYLATFDEAAAESAAEEFARLFLVAGPLPPRAMHWNLDPEGWQASALVAEALSRLRLQPLENLPPDHLGLLLLLLADSRCSDHPALTERLYSTLAPCMARFADAWFEHTRNPLYLAAARLASQLFEPRSGS